MVKPAVNLMNSTPEPGTEGIDADGRRVYYPTAEELAELDRRDAAMDKGEFISSEELFSRLAKIT